MNTTTSPTTVMQATTAHPATQASAMRRIVGVVSQPQSYRNIGYLLLGLPLGTVWFAVLVSTLSVAVSMVAVALLGIPMLLGIWYITRCFANVERHTANVLLGHHLAPAPMASPVRGNPWVRLRAMNRERDRWRELGYLMLRFPVGVATFTAAVTALATPVVVAYAPIAARHGGTHPFGEWRFSSRMEDIASSSPWSWLLVPLGLAMLVAAFHVLNALTKASGRWATASLVGDAHSTAI